MKNAELMNKITRGLGRIKLNAIKHSPEILLGVGIVTGITGAVVACKATPKACKIIEEKKAQLAEIRYVHEHADEFTTEENKYTDEDYKKDIVSVYTSMAVDVAKTYAPAVTLGVTSITSLLVSNRILNKRHLALAAAYATVDQAYKGYKERVVERFGPDMDRELTYNIKAKEIEEKVVDENGEEKVEKKTVQESTPPKFTGYTFVFDQYCLNHVKDADLNKMYLSKTQAFFNNKLRTDGYVFLNDILSELGIDRTKAGQSVGWYYDESRPEQFHNYIDFGILDIKDEQKRLFINGKENAVWLNFNVDGPILDLI